MEAQVIDQHEHLVGVRELLPVLGISKGTLLAMVAEGRVPHYRLRRQLRFKVSEVLEAVRGESGHK